TTGVRVRTIFRWRLSFVEYWRSNDAGFDDRHTDVERLHFLCQALAQRLKGPLGSRVGCLRSQSHSTCDRGHINDAAMTTFAHAWNYCLDTAQRTEKIGFHDFPEHRHRHLFDRSSATYSCIVHKNVDATVLRKRLADCSVDRGVIIHIKRSHRHRELLR